MEYKTVKDFLDHFEMGHLYGVLEANGFSKPQSLMNGSKSMFSKLGIEGKDLDSLLYIINKSWELDKELYAHAKKMGKAGVSKTAFCKLIRGGFFDREDLNMLSADEMKAALAGFDITADQDVYAVLLDFGKIEARTEEEEKTGHSFSRSAAVSRLKEGAHKERSRLLDVYLGVLLAMISFGILKVIGGMILGAGTVGILSMF